MVIREIAASLYPWDLADEGVDACLDKLVELAGVTSAYLVGVMHKEKRPLTSLFYSHNPKRKWYTPEDSRIYYRFSESSFAGTPLRPTPTSREFLRGDWLDVLIEAARRRSLKVGVEISHTIIDAERAMASCPEAVQCDIAGRPLPGHLCPNSPQAREYIRALFQDTVANHPVDFIQTCMLLFAPGRPISPPWFMDSPASGAPLRHLLGIVGGGCFCSACAEQAARLGHDWTKIIGELRSLAEVVNSDLGARNERVMDLHLLLGSDLTESGLMLEFPALQQFLSFRAASTTSLFRDIYQAVKAVRPGVEFRYNNHRLYPELEGVSFPAIKPYVDSVRDSDYAEQRGSLEGLDRKRATILKVRRGMGPDKPLLAGIAVRPKATPAIIAQSLEMLSGLGIDGLSLGHYDGSTDALLRAVRQGMEAAGIRCQQNGN
jgi:hypothetical protein